MDKNLLHGGSVQHDLPGSRGHCRPFVFISKPLATGCTGTGGTDIVGLLSSRCFLPMSWYLHLTQNPTRFIDKEYELSHVEVLAQSRIASQGQRGAVAHSV